ncbi:MAG: response regulator [Proteobacteria bacterium]|nr:response regulator [Pseudomonadota bacterium]
MNPVIDSPDLAVQANVNMRERFERNAAACITYICTGGLAITAGLIVAQQRWHIYPDPYAMLYLVITVPALIIAIGLSRLGYYRIAAVQMATLILGFLLHTGLITGGSEGMLTTTRFTPLAILLVAMVMPRRCAISIAVVEVLAVFVLFRINHIPANEMMDAVLFNSLFNCVFITTASVRNRYTRSLIKIHEKVASAVRLHEAVLLASFDGLAHVDVSQRVVEHNLGFGSLCGHPGLDLTGMAVDELLRSWTDKDHLQSLMNSERSSVRLTQGNGPERKLLEFNSIRVDGCGNVASVVALRDLNYKVESEQLRAEKAEIARKNQEKTKYLASLSHEIITPLATISGFSDFLIDQADQADLASRQHILSVINQNCNQLRRLLGGVINLSLIEEGVIDIKRQPVVLGGLLEQITQTQRAAADKRGLSLECNIDPDIHRVINGTILSDTHRIAQILNNLISNAIKFTARGVVRIEARMCGDQVAIDVSDSGPGIAQDDQERLFSFGERAATTANVAGFGLGLYLSKKIADKLGGDLVLRESTLAKGSVFRLTLPAGPAFTTDEGAGLASKTSTHHNIAGSSHGTTAANLAGLKILLVEDNEDMRFLTEHALRASGGDIKVVESGEQAIAVCSCDQTFDVILMDLSLPGISGLEATRTLRGAGLTTPIVAYTAHALDEERNSCLAIGFSDYVIKTSSRHALTQTIAQYRPVSAELTVD